MENENQPRRPEKGSFLNNRFPGLAISFFEFLLHIIFCINEFPLAFSKTFYEFRSLMNWAG